MSKIEDGSYAYRFKGFAQDLESIEYFLVGVGTLRFRDGKVEGEHRSTFLRLTPLREIPKDHYFKVEGQITHWDETSSSGAAQLVFTEQPSSASSQVLTGRFAVVHAGGGEYWLTSYGGADVIFGSGPAVKGSELVEGELRWVSA